MAIETVKDSLCVNQVILQKTNNFIIEDDVIVPDIKPDIINAVSTSGTVCIYKKEISNGKVKIEGKIDTYIMYLADTEDGYIRSLNTSLEFSQSFNISEAQDGMDLNLDLNVRSIDCKVLNGRKVNLRAIVDANIIISANENVDFIKQVNNVGDVQVLNKKFNVNSLVGSGETKTYAKDTIKLNETDNLAEIMKCNFRILNKDVKISYNKVLVKSDLEAKILYLTDDNRINSVETIIPVMGFIDVQDITEENICDVKYEICNVVIEPKSVEEHAIYVEVEIKIHGEAYQNKELNIIQDLYSPNAELSFTQKQIQAMQTKKTMQDTCSIRDKQIIPEMHGGKIYDVDIMPFIIKQSVSNNKILYEGEVKLNFVYSVNNFSGIDTREMVLPFNFSMQSDEIDTNTNIDTGIEVGLQNFVVTSDESIDIKIDLIFKVSMSNNSRINVIDGVEIDENKNIYKYSMVIYFVKRGDSLWKIAKKFGSTVSAIAEVNNIEQVDNISVGQQLFIPRYNG